MSRSPPKTPRGDPRISPTAYATAAAWAYYGFAEADIFDTRRGRAMLAALRLGTGLISPVVPTVASGPEVLLWRHRAFSNWIAEQDPRLAIEIGAGLSSRGQAYARAHPDMIWHDLDLPGMVATRRQRAAARRSPPNHHLGEDDLLDPTLGAAIEPPEHGPVIALTEGVVDYLDRAAKQRAWSHLAALLRRLGGGCYLAEVYPLRRFAAKAPGAALARFWATRDGSTLCYHEDDVRTLALAAGFPRARILPDARVADLAGVSSTQRLPFCLLEAET